MHFENSIRLQSLLPEFLKPIYQEGWKPFEEKHAFIRNQDFIKTVCVQEGKMHHYDLPDEQIASSRIRAVFQLIEKYADREKVALLKEIYPKQLKYILDREKSM